MHESKTKHFRQQLCSKINENRKSGKSSTINNESSIISLKWKFMESPWKLFHVLFFPINDAEHALSYNRRNPKKSRSTFRAFSFSLSYQECSSCFWKFYFETRGEVYVTNELFSLWYDLKTAGKKLFIRQTNCLERFRKKKFSRKLWNLSFLKHFSLMFDLSSIKFSQLNVSFLIDL